MVKVRQDFVTNSSSSSFVVIYEVDYNEKLKEYLKEEFGKYGIGLAEGYFWLGKDIKKDRPYEILDYIDEENIEDDKYYFSASFLEWTNGSEGEEGDDAWLARHLPDEYIVEIYNEGE